MHSYDLRAEGFVEWRDFSLNTKSDLLNDLPEKNGVYAIRDRRVFGRFINSSDILYIGCAPEKTLKERIGKYFNPEKSQGTNVNINAWLNRFNSFQISWKEINNGEINGDNEKKPSENYEKILLAWYEQDHGELPPFNCRH